MDFIKLKDDKILEKKQIDLPEWAELYYNDNHFVDYFLVRDQKTKAKIRNTFTEDDIKIDFCTKEEILEFRIQKLEFQVKGLTKHLLENTI